MAHHPNLTFHLSLDDRLAKSGFYIFKWMEKKSKEEYFVTHESYMKFKLEHP